MEDTTLGGVVSGLHLREVDNVTTHGGSSHKATVGEILQGLAVQIGALLFLSLPVGSSGLSAVEGSVQVNANNLGVVGKRAVNHGTLSPGDTSVGNEDIQTAIEFLDNLVDGLLNGLGVDGVALVGLNCDVLARLLYSTYTDQTYPEHHTSEKPQPPAPGTWRCCCTTWQH